MKNKITNKKRGFTVIETIVAILMLSVAVAGAFSAVRSGLQAAFYSRDQIVAFYLAQDALEYIRNERDTFMLQDSETGWQIFQNIVSDCSGGAKCSIDTTRNSLSDSETLSSSGSFNLRYDEGTALYSHQNGNPSSFDRSVEFAFLDDQQIKMTVIVSWRNGLSSKNIQISNTLFDWQY